MQFHWGVNLAKQTRGYDFKRQGRKSINKGQQIRKERHRESDADDRAGGQSQQVQEATLWQKGPRRRRGVSKWRSDLWGVELTRKSMVENGGCRPGGKNGNMGVQITPLWKRGQEKGSTGWEGSASSPFHCYFNPCVTSSSAVQTNSEKDESSPRLHVTGWEENMSLGVLSEGGMVGFLCILCAFRDSCQEQGVISGE